MRNQMVCFFITLLYSLVHVVKMIKVMMILFKYIYMN